MDIAKVATGEFWYGENAIQLGLIDGIKTSDEYLLAKAKEHQVVKVSFEQKPTLAEKISETLTQVFSQTFARVLEQNKASKRI